jgi:hypothetical protein
MQRNQLLFRMIDHAFDCIAAPSGRLYQLAACRCPLGFPRSSTFFVVSVSFWSSMILRSVEGFKICFPFKSMRLEPWQLIFVLSSRTL